MSCSSLNTRYVGEVVGNATTICYSTRNYKLSTEYSPGAPNGLDLTLAGLMRSIYDVVVVGIVGAVGAPLV